MLILQRQQSAFRGGSDSFGRCSNEILNFCEEEIVVMLLRP